MKKLDYLCKCESEISNVCIMVEGHCFHAMKIVRHHANSRFDLLLSGHQSINPSREAISILSGKYKRFMFVHPGDLYALKFVSGLTAIKKIKRANSIAVSEADLLSVYRLSH